MNIGGTCTPAALLVANLGTLGAFIGVALLAVNESGTADSAWRTLRVFIAYPLALFLTAAYTEGIFVAFATGHWWPPGADPGAGQRSLRCWPD